MPVPEKMSQPVGGAYDYMLDPPSQYAADADGKWSQPAPSLDAVMNPYTHLPDGVFDVTDSVRDGAADWYDKKWRRRMSEDKSIKFLLDGDGRIYQAPVEYEPKPGAGFRTVGFSDVVGMLPKRDYIGGRDKEDVRAAVAKRIPGFTAELSRRAAAYGLSPNLLYNRLSKEGYLDQLAQNYNDNMSSREQREFDWGSLWDEEVDGYGSFGLDYVGDELAAGKYRLLDKNAHWGDAGPWRDAEGSDGVRVMNHRVFPSDLHSAIEMLAAALKYRREQAKRMYNPSDDELDAYTNAAYNLGLGAADMNNHDYVMRTYSFPDLYSKYGFEYADGGSLGRVSPATTDSDRVRRLASALSALGYTRDNLFGDGGGVSGGDGDKIYYGGELAPAVVTPEPVVVQLITSKVSKEHPISHSALTHPQTTEADKPLVISKGFSSPTYNLLFNNCSDDTGMFLEDALGMSLTKGITTPGKIRRAVEKSPNLLSTEKSEDGTIQKIQIPWYDYTKAWESYQQRMLYDYEKRMGKRQGDDAARDATVERVDDLNKKQPRLQYYIDRDGNVVGQESRYVYPSAKPHAEGGLLRRYDGGGDVSDSAQTNKSRVAELARRINETSNADFVRRLLDERRRALDNGDGSVSTHRLSYVDDGNGNAVVFPEVQSSDYGNLLTRVPYPMSYERAVERGDTVHMSTPDAAMFTEGYKNVYPGFGQYAVGGLLRKYEDGGQKTDILQESAPVIDISSGTLPGAMYVQRPVVDVAPIPYSDEGHAVQVAEDKRLLALEDIAARLKILENNKSNKRGGWSASKGVWYPHESAEGGAKTIGYGIKLSNGTKWATLAKRQKFLTDAQAEEAVVDMSSDYYGRARDAYDEMFGVGAWNALPWKAQSILTDYEYNSKNGLRSFPKLSKAIHDGDIEAAKSESGRHSGGTPLEERNRRMLEELDSLSAMLSADSISVGTRRTSGR